MRAFEASVEETFNAWLDPRVMHRWLFVTAISEIVEIDLCPHTGGAFTITAMAGDRSIDHRGRFDLVVKPRHLAFTLDGEPPVTVDLSPREAGCELTLEQPGSSLDRWGAMLDRLAALLRR
ncbi:MAG: SRPBCC domain-containing protein [Deltaproteobacteria bacterium]|nr:SRPBCC domain-containing protein [Deltaproteobacteria bacterium]